MTTASTMTTTTTRPMMQVCETRDLKTRRRWRQQQQQQQQTTASNCRTTTAPSSPPTLAVGLKLDQRTPMSSQLISQCSSSSSRTKVSQTACVCRCVCLATGTEKPTTASKRPTTMLLLMQLVANRTRKKQCKQEKKLKFLRFQQTLPLSLLPSLAQTQRLC